MGYFNDVYKRALDYRNLDKYKKEIKTLKAANNKQESIIKYYKKEKKILKSAVSNCGEELHGAIKQRSLYNAKFQKLANKYNKVKKGLDNSIETLLDKKYKSIKIQYTKRSVLGSEKGLALSVQDFCRPSVTLMTKKKVSQIFNLKIKYVKDEYVFKGMTDVWLFPEETMTFKAGDCEDLACLRHAMIKSSQNIDLVQKNRYFIALGYMGKVGHCFNVEVSDKGDFIIHEPTTSLFKPLNYKNSKYKIYFLFNEFGVWRVKGGVRFGVVKKDFGMVERRK